MKAGATKLNNKVNNMAYKENTKKYKVTYTVVKEQTVEELLPTLFSLYDDMCDYHKVKITDINHVANYFRKTTGIDLNKADKDYVEKHIVKGLEVSKMLEATKKAK